MFCLCPVGWAHWSPRFFEAIQAGCIPVLFPSEGEDANVLPFERSVNYARFVVSVPAGQVGSLSALLFAVARNRVGLRRRQRALWRHRSQLDWTDIGEHGAFYTLLAELARRRGLS